MNNVLCVWGSFAAISRTDLVARVLREWDYSHLWKAKISQRRLLSATLPVPRHLKGFSALRASCCTCTFGICQGTQMYATMPGLPESTCDIVATMRLPTSNASTPCDSRSDCMRHV